MATCLLGWPLTLFHCGEDRQLLALYLEATRPEEQIVLATIDIKNAFLKVPQKHSVVAKLLSNYKGEGKFFFLKCT